VNGYLNGSIKYKPKKKKSSAFQLAEGNSRNGNSFPINNSISNKLNGQNESFDYNIVFAPFTIRLSKSRS